MTTENDKSHYVFIKDFNRLMFSTTKHKDKKHFCMHCLQNFTTEEVQCLFINGCQAVNYESGAIKFINYNKQIPIPFKIYADTECFLKRTNSYEGKYTIKYQEHFPNSIGTKLVCIDMSLLIHVGGVGLWVAWVSWVYGCVGGMDQILA